MRGLLYLTLAHVIFAEFSSTWQLAALKLIQRIESAPSKPLNTIFSGLDFRPFVPSALTLPHSHIPAAHFLLFDFVLVFIVATGYSQRTLPEPSEWVKIKCVFANKKERVKEWLESKMVGLASEGLEKIVLLSSLQRL
jgi:hypothetical protein